MHPDVNLGCMNRCLNQPDINIALDSIPNKQSIFTCERYITFISLLHYSPNYQCYFMLSDKTAEREKNLSNLTC